MMKRISIIGSTGSIGTQTLDIVRKFPDRFQVVALAAGRSVEKLAEQAREFGPKLVSVADESAAGKLKGLVPRGTEVCGGREGLLRAAVVSEADTLVTAVVGAAGIEPTFEAVKAGKNIALANKETLVAAGSLLMPAVRKAGVELMPVDSEHSALFQCLTGERRREVQRLILTCSGGPFRGRKTAELERVTPEQALGHPNWSMGAKISVDSATLMNKGLEVIEAMWLYGIPHGKIDVVVHPQSIVHSMVEFVDGNIMGQIGPHDMRLPIQYALSYPERLHNESLRLDLVKVATLTFEGPDMEAFPCLRLAYDAAGAGGTMPAVLNAANEVAVEAFLGGKAAFLDIPRTIEGVMAACGSREVSNLRVLLDADRAAREKARQLLGLETVKN